MTARAAGPFEKDGLSRSAETGVFTPQPRERKVVGAACRSDRDDRRLRKDARGCATGRTAPSGRRRTPRAGPRASESGGHTASPAPADFLFAPIPAGIPADNMKTVLRSAAQVHDFGWPGAGAGLERYRTGTVAGVSSSSRPTPSRRNGRRSRPTAGGQVRQLFWARRDRSQDARQRFKIVFDQRVKEADDRSSRACAAPCPSAARRTSSSGSPGISRTPSASVPSRPR